MKLDLVEDFSQQPLEAASSRAEQQMVFQFSNFIPARRGRDVGLDCSVMQCLRLATD